MTKGIPQSKVSHLMRRAAFGPGMLPGPEDARQLYKESEKIIPLEVVTKPQIDDKDLMSMRDNPNRREKLKEMLSASRENLLKLNLQWMSRMTEAPSLRERMTFFCTTTSPAAETLARMEDFLLARPTTIGNRQLVTSMASRTLNEEEFVKKAFIGFMSLPEYQLC